MGISERAKYLIRNLTGARYVIGSNRSNTEGNASGLYDFLEDLNSFLVCKPLK